MSCCRYDLAHVVEVRRGHSTDTFHDVQRLPDSRLMASDRSFSIIFDHRVSANKMSLDLICPNSQSRKGNIYRVYWPDLLGNFQHSVSNGIA